MIFVTVGTQLPFDRLIEGIDQWAESNPEMEVFVQSGKSSCKPQNCNWRQFISQASFDYFLEKADVIVAHAGVGSILSALEYGKPIIVLPRRLEFKEHRNDHQLATAERFCTLDSVHVAWEIEDLPSLLNDVKAGQRNRFDQPSTSGPLIRKVREFVTRQPAATN